MKARDVLEIAGLTYRQLHDWEQRAGVLESERASSDGWRKFTLEEVMALTICTRLRDTLSLPLKHTGDIYRWLVGERPSSAERARAAGAEKYLEVTRREPKCSAILEGYPDTTKMGCDLDMAEVLVKEYVGELINRHSTRPVQYALMKANLGFSILLCSDFEISQILTEHQLVGWIGLNTVAKPTIIFRLNDLLNEILEKVGMPQNIATDHFSYLDYWKKLEEHASVTPSEQKVIRMIRERGYQRLTAHVVGGEIIRVEREEGLTPHELAKIEEQIMEVIRNGDHQTVTVEKRDGKVVRIVRRQSIKLDKVTGKP